MLIFLLIICGIILLVSHSVAKNNRKIKAEQELYNKNYRIFKEIEDARGDYETDIVVQIKASDLPKLGYPDNYTGLYSLVKGKTGNLHFSYPNSPELKLLEIEYMPEYQQVTNGNVSGKTGSAIVGTAILGSAGGVIGSSGKRKINTTSTQKEINTFGLLTFLNIATNKKFIVSFVLNKAVYTRLKSDFLTLD